MERIPPRSFQLCFKIPSSYISLQREYKIQSKDDRGIHFSLSSVFSRSIIEVAYGRLKFKVELNLGPLPAVNRLRVMDGIFKPRLIRNDDASVATSNNY